MLKKIMVFTMVAAITLTENINVYATTEEEMNQEKIKVEFVDQNTDLNDIKNETEAVIINETKIACFSEEEIDELLDDGVCLLELGSNADEVNNYFGSDVCEESDDKNVVGYKIEKKAEKVIANPISVVAVDVNGEEIESGNEYEELIDGIRFDKNDYNILVEDRNIEEDCLKKINKEDIALLQTSNSVGESYYEVSRTTYYYGEKGLLDIGTKALKKGKSVGSGWNHLGYSVTTLSVYNVGGKGNKKYDLFMGNIEVGALNDYKLDQFTGQMRLYNQNSCTIIDSSILQGDKNESVSTSIGAGLGFSEKGVSASLSGGYSYSYNPNGMSITNTSGDDELQPNWICSKEEPKENEKYIIKPSIVVKSPSGKTKETMVSMRVKNLHFKGYWDTYYVKNRSGSEFVYITVKNHKKVKAYE